jgi:copper(I)-binding protein
MALVCSAAVADPGAGLVLESAWVRALPPTQANTAAYLELSNRGEVALSVVGGRAALAERLEIHTTREIDGYMRMEQLDQLQLEPGETLRLEPGGTHLMLLGLERMPAVGESVRLCLELAAGGEVCTEAPVRKSESSASSHHHHHQQD